MQKKFILITFLTSLLAWPAAAFAQWGFKAAGQVAGYNTTQTVYSIIPMVVGVVLSFTSILFFAFMIYAGLRWMTARGNDELAEKSKNTLQAATIGFIVIVLSYALTTQLFNVLKIGQATPAAPPAKIGPSSSPDACAGSSEIVCKSAEYKTYCVWADVGGLPSSCISGAKKACLDTYKHSQALDDDELDYINCLRKP